MAICTQCSGTLPELPGLASAKLEEIAFELGMSQKIEAIRILREALPSIGLKEAKEYVDCPHKAPSATGPSAPPPSSVPAACPSCGKTLPLPSRGDEVVRELAAGNKIVAIKIVREVTGLGLKEAKDYVECPHASATTVGPPATTAPTTLGACPACGVHVVVPGADGPRAAAFVEALRKGEKIGAIKIVREVTGWGLKESKDFVDCPHALPTARAEPPPDAPPPTSPPRPLPVRAESGVRAAGCAILVILFVVMPLTAVVAVFFIGRATAAEQEARYERRQQEEEHERKVAEERKARIDQERAKQAHLDKTSCPTCRVRMPTHAKLALDVRMRVVELLKAGQKIEAIKAVRTATGWGLMEAKKYVDCPHQVPP